MDLGARGGAVVAQTVGGAQVGRAELAVGGVARAVRGTVPIADVLRPAVHP